MLFVPRLPARLRRIARLSRSVGRLTRASIAGLLRVGWMLVGSPWLVWFALRAPFSLRRFRRLPDVRPGLARLSPGIWRAPPRALGASVESKVDALTVLHFTGTGESVHAAYENTRLLFEGEPLLADAPHYLFEAPLERGAYYGPELFAAAVWQRVAPIVRHYEGPFVLVGMSRGALMALEHGMRIVEEQGKVASVLALSAPLRVPKRIPRAIATIAGFVPTLEAIEQSLSERPPLVRSMVEPWVRYSYTLLTAMVLHYHGVYRVDGLERNVLDVRDHGALPGALRASREFRLLVRASERKLQLFCQLVTQVLARHPERFFAAFIWGAEDRWIDAASCREWFEATSREHHPELVLQTEVCPGLGHLVRAQRAPTRDLLASWFARAANEAVRLELLSGVRKEALRALQNELHLASEARREHE